MLYCLWEASWYGGISGIIKERVPEPNWNSTSIKAAKNKKEAELNLILDNIQNKLDLEYAGKSVSGTCTKGDHSWKRNDPFAYECRLGITRFYSFNGDFRAKLVELDTALRNQGWEASWRPMSYMLREYYDDLENSNYAKRRLVSVLPDMSYENKELNYLRLNIDYAQKETPDTEIQQTYVKNYNSYNEVHSEKSPDDILEIFRSATKNDYYFLSISTSEEYFSN